MIDRTSVIIDFIRIQQVLKLFNRFDLKNGKIIKSALSEFLKLNKITAQILESIENLYLDEIEAFCNEFLALIRLSPDVCMIDCITARDISKSEQDLLENNLSHTVDGSLFLTYTVDPSIIGGMVLKIRDSIYDGSHKSYLDKLKLLCVREILGED